MITRVETTWSLEHIEVCYGLDTRRQIIQLRLSVLCLHLSTILEHQTNTTLALLTPNDALFSARDHVLPVCPNDINVMSTAAIDHLV